MEGVGHSETEDPSWNGEGPRRTRACAGLTLIEVMLAVAILAIGIFVLIDGASRCLAVIRITQNYHAARAVLSQAELDYPLVEEKQLGNESEMLNMEVADAEYPQGFTFSRTCQKIEEEEGLYVVTERVTWPGRGQNTAEEIVSYLFYTNKIE